MWGRSDFQGKAERDEMRSTNEIIIAVKECQPVTEDELKLALCAMSGIHYHLKRSLEKTISDIEDGKPEAMLKYRAGFEKGTLEVMFNAIKMPPDEFLGPDNTPGTPEFKKRLDLGKAIFKKATGLDL